jgi:prevent-host-death family protein
LQASPAPLKKPSSIDAGAFLFLAKLAKSRLLAMQVNMLDAKSQLSRLVRAALAGEEVIIASHGKAQARLVPCPSAAGLKRPGALAAASPDLLPEQVDAVFSEAVDQQVAQLFNS